MGESPVRLIAAKRDGREHSPRELEALIEDFMAGRLADYQMSAWLMAAYLRGLSDAEMVALTSAMLHSGDVLRHVGLPGPAIDKHSTGGVGDKLSLPLAPLAAECGLFVPMISGRGLGHTGGTLDKLESIPGYDVRLSEARFRRVVREVGASIIGQTRRLAPADRRIYALRDVTGTVACRPLIVASILSKKLAAGLDGLVLDVKVGRGAFMTSLAQARALARSLVSVSTALGTPATAMLTRMDVPLGRMIGNALEVREAIEILSGVGPEDSTELTLALGEDMLLLGRVEPTRPRARARLLAALSSGRALERFGRMIALHGGDARVLERPALLPRAPQRRELCSPRAGWVVDIDARALADVALGLGAGRTRAEDAVDPAVGIEILARPGVRVEAGDPLALLHLRADDERALESALAAFRIGGRRLSESSLVLGRVKPKADSSG